MTNNIISQTFCLIMGSDSSTAHVLLETTSGSYSSSESVETWRIIPFCVFWYYNNNKNTYAV